MNSRGMRRGDLVLELVAAAVAAGRLQVG